MNNPYAELLGFSLRLGARGSGRCSARLPVRAQLLNPNGVLHGGALFSIADTAMGAALHTLLAPGEACATIEIKMHFLRAVKEGRLSCRARVVQRGRRVAVVEAQVRCARQLVAQALGSFAIFAAEPQSTKGTGLSE